jgi:prepilin-type N-terminal cleavage/methylation domain-containing protein
MIQRGGMTLVELLVVLAILALLTTVAVTSTDVVLSQGRYDATKGTLTNIQEAVLGPPNARQADGTLVSMGFAADVGRWPVCTSTDLTGGSSGGPWGGPWELLFQPAGIASFALVQSQNDPDVVVPCGWRGPYLRLSPGQTSIRDGWGNPLILLNQAGSPAAAGDPIWSVSSSGGGNGLYNGSLGVNFPPPQNTVGGSVAYGIVISGAVNAFNFHRSSSSGNTVQVWMYGPNPNTGGLWELQCTTTKATDGVVSYGPPYQPSGASSGVSSVYAAGFLRAYVGDRSTATRHSAIVRFQQSGVINLNIQ